MDASSSSDLLPPVMPKLSPLCKWKKKSTQSFTAEIVVDTVEQAASTMGGTFCRECARMVKASYRVQIEELFQ